MKILILSDSHGELNYMQQAIDREKPDYVIHLGDHAGDAEKLRRIYPMLPVASVRGNCDYSDWDVPEQRVLVYGGLRILACHGHRYGVKNGLLRYRYAAQEQQVNAALFGHTHSPFCQLEDGLWLINPGSSGYFRPTCAVMEIINEKIICEIKEL